MPFVTRLRFSLCSEIVSSVANLPFGLEIMFPCFWGISVLSVHLSGRMTRQELHIPLLVEKSELCYACVCERLTMCKKAPGT